jgi:zinc protease
VWIRPVVPADAQFALRAGLYEVQKLHDQGMSKEDFEATRNLLINYSKLWAQNLSARLGFMMDSRFYGMPYYIDQIESRLKSMTVEQVNAAAKKYLDPANFHAVLVTDNAQQLADTLKKDGPSPKTYNTQAAPAVLEADKTIQVLKVNPAKIDIVPVDQVFQK